MCAACWPSRPNVVVEGGAAQHAQHADSADGLVTHGVALCAPVAAAGNHTGRAVVDCLVKVHCTYERAQDEDTGCGCQHRSPDNALVCASAFTGIPPSRYPRFRQLGLLAGPNAFVP